MYQNPKVCVEYHECGAGNRKNHEQCIKNPEFGIENHELCVGNRTNHEKLFKHHEFGIEHHEFDVVNNKKTYLLLIVYDLKMSVIF